MDEKKVQQGCVIGCFGLIVVFALLTVILVSCSVDGEEEVKAFDFTVDEYEDTLKQVVNERGNEMFFKIGLKEETEENQYIIPLTKSRNIAAFVDKNEEGKVTETQMGTTGNAFLVYNKEVLIAFEIFVKSVDPTISATQLLVLFENLGINGNGSMLDHTGSYSLNEVSYTYFGNIEDDRITLIAEPE